MSSTPAPLRALLALSTLAAAALGQERGPAGEPPPKLALVRVELPRDAARRTAFLAGGFDLTEHRTPAGGAVEVIASRADLDRLRGLGLELEVVDPDVVATNVARLEAEPPLESAPPYGAWLAPPFGQGSMSGYYTWSEVASVLDQVAAAYPSIVTPKFSLGTSHEGRELWAVKLSDNPGVDEAEPEVRIDAMHHAREPGAMQTMLWTLLALVEDYGSDPLATWIVDHREVWFVPVVNPDGYVYNQTTNPNGGGMWRKNRRDNGTSFGVDLNRNYPYAWGFDNVGSSPTPSSGTYRGPAPVSEPEIAAMIAFFDAREFRTAISAHTYSNLWLAPFGYTPTPPPDQAELDEIGALATVVNGYPYGIANILLYPFNGITIDTDYELYDTYSWLPEIGPSSFWPPASQIVPLAEENRLGFYRTALAAGAWVHVVDRSVVDLGDGDGHLEPGEPFELAFSLRNSGRDATSGAVTLALASPSAELSLDVASRGLPAMGSFSSAGTGSSPLAFTVAPGAARGTVVEFTTSVSWDGYVESFRTVVPLGEPAPLLFDDGELDLGWTLGEPGDTATSGLWAFGDPVATSSGGSPSNPGNDASPEGVSCFTTGNGSTSASGDDVDDGFTTLVSPPIDLSSSPSAVLSYARWFANFQNVDDALEVAISNDGGGSWTPLETVSGNRNAWTRASFVVNEHVAPSADVRLRFRASDEPDNSIAEAAVDELRVDVYDGAPHLAAWGTPGIGRPLAVHVTAPGGSPYWVYASETTASVTLPSVVGTILIDLGSAVKLFTGTTAPAGLARRVATVPDDTALLGRTFHLQGLVLMGAQLVVTNADQVAFWQGAR